jgi:hypothetical protein
MSSSGMRCRLTLVKNDVLEERIATIIRMKRLSDLGTTLAVLQLRVTSNVVPSSLILFTLMTVIRYSETPALTRATRHRIREDIVITVKTANLTRAI